MSCSTFPTNGSARARNCSCATFPMVIGYGSATCRKKPARRSPPGGNERPPRQAHQETRPEETRRTRLMRASRRRAAAHRGAHRLAARRGPNGAVIANRIKSIMTDLILSTRTTARASAFSPARSVARAGFRPTNGARAAARWCRSSCPRLARPPPRRSCQPQNDEASPSTQGYRGGFSDWPIELC